MPHPLTRRHFLRSAALGAAALTGSRSLGEAVTSTAPVRGAQPANPGGSQRTDILVILADDMGFSDIGCFGGEIDTPHLDKLGRRGVRFSQAYNTARCCPSRAALLTGLYPHQAGVGHMVVDLGSPAYQGYLRKDCVTMAEALKPAGYRTWISGKWHVGGNQAPNRPETWLPGTETQPSPLDRGFDRYFGNLGGAGSYYRPPILMKQRDFIVPGGGDFYYTDAIGDHACEFIREAAASGDPFFGYVAFTAPHWPLHARPEDIEKYRDRFRAGWDHLREERLERIRAAGLVPDHQTLSPRDSRAPAWDSLDEERREWECRRMAVYAAMIDRLDQNVGRILDCLRETGRLDQTLIVFLADNGGSGEELAADGGNVERYHLPMGNGRRPDMGNRPGLMPGPENTFQSYGPAWANVSNTPFRRFKMWAQEGGIATPLILNHPSINSAEGRVVHDPCLLIDVMPTVLDFAGVNAPAEHNGVALQPLEGRSLRAPASGQASEAPRTLFWEHSGNRAVRVGDLKLVADYGQPWELYDLAHDRAEVHDLAAARPQAVADLEARWHEWADRVGVRDWGELETVLKKYS